VGPPIPYPGLLVYRTPRTAGVEAALRDRLDRITVEAPFEGVARSSGEPFQGLRALASRAPRELVFAAPPAPPLPPLQVRLPPPVLDVSAERELYLRHRSPLLSPRVPRGAEGAPEGARK
jgi:hypothetical protein